MIRRLSISAAVAVLAMLGGGEPAGAAIGLERARGFAPDQVVVKLAGQPRPHTVRVPGDLSVREATAALREDPRVAYAAPNFIATASATPPAPLRAIPNDPGPIVGPPGPPGGWVVKQWNFLPWAGPATPLMPLSPGGIDAIAAWEHLEAVGRPGAVGTTVAVLDTGVAYRTDSPRFLRSPDFTSSQFVRGYDFVDDDTLPLDENGHGTHVAGTIAEKTNNGIGLTGLAYRAKLMPVRVLDQAGRGRADDIAQGIRFAIANGADVINMSFNFGCHRRVPSVNEALRQAFRKGVVTVASVGNIGAETCVSPPATGPRTIGVGGSTEGGCLGDYSLSGEDVDLLAPGGGTPAIGCPSVSAGPIYQVTFKGPSVKQFGEPSSYVGTSMAAAHVSGVAAMVLASGAIDSKAKSQRRAQLVTKRLRETARDLGFPAIRQGAGLIDAGRATEPPA